MSLRMILLSIGTGITAGAVDSTISVSGRVTINAVPDGVVWQLQVTTKDPDTPSSRVDNDRATLTVTNALSKAGLPAADIAQSVYEQEQAWRSEGANSRVADGWTTQRTLTVTLGDMAQYQRVADAIGSCPSVAVLSIVFTVHNQTDLVAQARTAALMAARAKAQAMATTLGSALGKPLTITEDHVGWSSGVLEQRNATFFEPGVGSGTAVLAGRIPVTAAVTITFALIEVPGR